MCDCSESLSFHLISRIIVIKKNHIHISEQKLRSPRASSAIQWRFPAGSWKALPFYSHLNNKLVLLGLCCLEGNAQTKRNSCFGLSQQIQILSYKLNMITGAMEMTKTKRLWNCFPPKGVYTSLLKASCELTYILSKNRSFLFCIQEWKVAQLLWADQSCCRSFWPALS